MVEFALILPFLIFLVGGVYTVWTALHQDIGLTNAARAGAIDAVTQFDLVGAHPPTSATKCAALKAAGAAVAGEEGISSASVQLSDPSNWCGALLTCSAGNNPCVSLAWNQLSLSTPGQVYYETTVTINQQITARIPLVSGVHVSANATEATK
jgi:Flp pilus assembly protein TadG